MIYNVDAHPPKTLERYRRWVVDGKVLPTREVEITDDLTIRLPKHTSVFYSSSHNSWVFDCRFRERRLMTRIHELNASGVKEAMARWWIIWQNKGTGRGVVHYPELDTLYGGVGVYQARRKRTPDNPSLRTEVYIPPSRDGSRKAIKLSRTVGSRKMYLKNPQQTRERFRQTLARMIEYRRQYDLAVLNDPDSDLTLDWDPDTIVASEATWAHMALLDLDAMMAFVFHPQP